jgi:predicted hydrocarbon binding protein
MEKLPFHTDPDRKIQKTLLYQALKASRELLGEDGFRAVINRCERICPGMGIYCDDAHWPPPTPEWGPPARHYSALSQAIEEVGGGRAQLVRIGIETAKMGITDLGAAMKAQLTILKRLPGFKWRAETILKAMVDDLLDSCPGDRELNAIYVKTDEKRKVISLVDRTGDTCHRRTGATAPVCHLYRGGIIGAVEQATGYIPNVTEIMCMACSDPACIFEVDFDPVQKAGR